MARPYEEPLPTRKRLFILYSPQPDTISGLLNHTLGGILQITLHTDRDVFDHLHGEWNALLKRSSANLIFLTWEWQSTWWDAYQAGDLWLVTCRSDDGTLVGIAPWFIENRADERVLRTIGCVDVTDYVDIIVSAQDIEAVVTELSAFLATHRQAYTRINLCNIQESSPTLKYFPKQLQLHGFSVEVELQEVCPIITLPADWEAYLESLDKKQRHELRRKMRRMEGEQVERMVVGADADIEVETERFLGLMRASHPDKALFLENPRNATFFRNVIRLLHTSGWLQISFLVINGLPSAAYCNFDYDGRILIYNSGLVPDENAQLSPGIVLLCYDIQSAIKAERAAFDFLRGNEIYKYRMGAKETQVFKLKAN